MIWGTGEKDMVKLKSIFIVLAMAVAFAFPAGMTSRAHAASAQELERDSRQALQRLYKANEAAGRISGRAKAILIFPNIVKAGFVFGGSYGEGVLMEGGNVKGYYNSVSGSWGLQIGAQSYGYALFLMTDKALEYVHESRGWEVGVGPTVVMVDEGVAKNLSTSTLKDDVYAFTFGQQGLMAGISLEGSKITRIRK